VGFLDLLRRSSPEEKAGLRDLEMMMVGSGVPDAQEVARGIVSTALEMCKRAGLPPHRTGIGDLFLAGAFESEFLRRRLEWTAAEGATQEDFRWWWNLSPFDQEVMEGTDELFRLAAFMAAVHEGLTEEERHWKVRRSFPIYGDPAKPGPVSGEDGPLPCELKDRINRWMERWAADKEGLRQKAAESSSMNALIRDEMRKGNL
jgi:hypothetical protein